jgi:hypothetical protein
MIFNKICIKYFIFIFKAIWINYRILSCKYIIILFLISNNTELSFNFPLTYYLTATLFYFVSLFNPLIILFVFGIVCYFFKFMYVILWFVIHHFYVGFRVRQYGFRVMKYFEERQKCWIFKILVGNFGFSLPNLGYLY